MNDEGIGAAATATATTEGTPALTASFSGAPAEHEGAGSTLTVRVTFSEA